MYLAPHCQRGPKTTVGPRTGHVSPRTAGRGPRGRWASGQAMYLSPNCQRRPTTMVGPRTGHASLPALLTEAHENGGLQDRPCISPRTANRGPRRRWVPGQAMQLSPHCWQRPTRTVGFRTGHVSLPAPPTGTHTCHMYTSKLVLWLSRFDFSRVTICQRQHGLGAVRLSRHQCRALWCEFIRFPWDPLGSFGFSLNFAVATMGKSKPRSLVAY